MKNTEVNARKTQRQGESELRSEDCVEFEISMSVADTRRINSRIEFVLITLAPARAVRSRFAATKRGASEDAPIFLLLIVPCVGISSSGR